MEPADPRRYVRYEVRFAVDLSEGGQRQTCEAEDVSAGGCRVVVLFPLTVGQAVHVRLRSDRTAVEPSGLATVAWTSRVPPYRAGLQFSDALAEQAIAFVQALLGPVRLTRRA